MNEPRMDLLDIGETQLYFDLPSSPAVEALLLEAADAYGEPGAETALLRAYFLAPQQLSVLVGLYRYYFYQHRMDDALTVAERAMSNAAQRLSLVPDWRHLDISHLGAGAQRSMGLLRFYLLALKASAVVLLRQGKLADAQARLNKIVELDALDRLGAAALLPFAEASDESGEFSERNELDEFDAVGRRAELPTTTH